MKPCKGCGVVKSLDLFAINKGGKFGRNSRCKACVSAAAKKRHLANLDDSRARAKERQKAYRDQHRGRLSDQWRARRRRVTLAAYGLTPERYDQMLKEQGHCCALCGSADPQHWSNQFHVDHDHETGAVRGLLCAPCNGGLGLLGDRPERLQAALAYVLASTDVVGLHRAS